jgi:hypothetical protein
MTLSHRDMQHPLAHEPPAQHGCPGPPHFKQRRPKQVMLESRQRSPEQHGPPSTPQTAQVLEDEDESQMVPGALQLCLLESPSQHASPTPPHFWQA